MTIHEIMERYNNEEITIEEANAELAKIGANFHLEDGRDGSWTEQEMAEGFMPGPAAERLPDGPVMMRRKDLAGQTVVQRTKRGRYEVTYGADGYAEKAIHL